MIYSQLRSLLFKLPPEMAHALSLNALSLLPKACFSNRKKEDAAFELLGLTFPNKVGLAAGLDKNGDYLDGLSKLGFGFIEIGTVTPKAQAGNPKPRLFRLLKDEALINRMGFNNKGVEHLITQVKNAQYQGVLGINIGKNLNTPVERAVDDYEYVFNNVYEFASYITVNVSSPNTPGLRALQHGPLLQHLFNTLKKQQRLLSDKHKRYVPMLAKLAPDLDEEQLKESVAQLVAIGIDGFVFSNTTNAKVNLKSKKYTDESGGLSGRPLMKHSTESLTVLNQLTDLPIIGVGGIMSADDATVKFKSGASLIQLYSGLIYRGPQLITDCVNNA